MSLGSFLRRAAGRRVLNLGSLSTLGRLQLVLRFPSVARLSYRLFLDPRVPVKAKATTLGVIAFVLSPVDIPTWVPVLGQFGDIVVIVNLLDVFIRAAPRHVVRQHIHELGLEDKFRI